MPQITKSPKCGYYFPHRDNQRDGIKRYFGGFDSILECKWYSAFHRGCAVNAAQYEHYDQDLLDTITAHPEDFPYKFMDKSRASYVDCKYSEIKNYISEKVADGQS